VFKDLFLNKNLSNQNGEEPYFITAGCYQKKPYLDCDVKKEYLYKTICEELKRYLAELHGWVVLDNHYHILLKLKDAFLLSKLIQAIHAKSAISINRMDKEHGRKVWYNFWDVRMHLRNVSVTREIFTPS